MNRFYLPDAFKRPIDYVIPPNVELINDTQHPELNSHTFRHLVSQYKSPQDFLPCYSSIVQNDDGLFILGSNEYTTVTLQGIVGGTYNFDDFVTSNFKNSAFTAILKDNIVDICLLDKITFVATTTENTVHLYSTKPKVVLQQDNHRESFCFVKLDSKNTDGEPLCISRLCSQNRFLIGTSNCNFECYEHDSNGLFQVFNIQFGHSLEITGISANPTIDTNWLSVSSDKSCLLWDKRRVYPATPIIEKHHDRLTSVHWYDDDTVILADAAGNIMSYDIKNLKTHVFKQHVVNRTINSLTFKNGVFGVISESKNLFIYKVDQNKELRLLDESIHPNMLNAICWDGYDKKDSYYIVGEEKYAKEMKLPDNL